MHFLILRKTGSLRHYNNKFYGQKRRRKHTAHNAPLPTILSKCRYHMITSFQNGLNGGTSAAGKRHGFGNEGGLVSESPATRGKQGTS